eukprot:Opistho-1_new@6956
MGRSVLAVALRVRRRRHRAGLVAGKHVVEARERVGGDGPRGGAEVHIISVEHRDHVAVRVVIIEVVVVVVRKARARNACVHEEADIRALAVRRHLRRVDRRQQFADVRHDGTRRVIASELNALRLEHAEVGLHHNIVVGDIRLVRVIIGVAADATIFLGRPEHQANRALGAEAELLNGEKRGPRDEGAAAVVHGALAHIPRVEMAAKEHDLLGVLRTDNLRHHVAGLRVRECLGLHLELKDDALPTRLHARKQLGVLHRDARNGDLRHAVLIVHRARVRAVDRIRRHRPHERSHRTDGASGRRASRAIRDRDGVRHPVRIEHDNLPLCLRRACGELVERRDDKGLGDDALGGRRDAVAEAEKSKAVHAGFENAKGLVAALPVRDHHVLAMHVVEAIGGELRKRKVDGRLQLRCAGEPWAVRVHEGREPIVRRALPLAARDVVNERLGVVRIRGNLVRPAVKGGRRGGTREGRGERNDRQSHAHLRVSLACSLRRPPCTLR